MPTAGRTRRGRDGRESTANSTGRTFEILRRIAKKDERVRVIRFARNFGFQKSPFVGYLRGRGARSHARGISATVFSYSFGIVASFVLNRSWTFNDRSSGAQLYRRFALFALTYGVALLLSTLLVVVFGLVVTDVTEKVLSVPLVFLWSYGVTRAVVFRSAEPG